jgi:hypothetical protein
MLAIKSAWIPTSPTRACSPKRSAQLSFQHPSTPGLCSRAEHWRAHQISTAITGIFYPRLTTRKISRMKAKRMEASPILARGRRSCLPAKTLRRQIHAGRTRRFRCSAINPTLLGALIAAGSGPAGHAPVEHPLPGAYDSLNAATEAAAGAAPALRGTVPPPQTLLGI